jgi:xylose isomerase
VLTKYFETVKRITKSFVDSSTEDFLVCSPYASFLAWASQFIIYCRQNLQLEKVQQQVRSLEKDMDEKNEKQQSVKNIVNSLTGEGFLELFEREIHEDEARIA